MKVKNIAHLAFQVRDLEQSLKFYCGRLGFVEKFRINIEVLIPGAQARHQAGEVSGMDFETYLAALKSHSADPWLVYLEVSPLQFIELFPDYFGGGAGKTTGAQGYLHLALEVDDIDKARRELLEKGATLDSEVTRGGDNTYQFWMSDPDGNRIEVMQYTPQSLQLVGPRANR